MRLPLFALLLSLLFSAPLATAQSAYSVESVAPFVPSTVGVVEQMLELGQVGPGDYHIDLGSGNGRIVIAAAQRGALAHGVEINRRLVEGSRTSALEAGVADQTVFLQQDIFDTDFSQATVVTLYLMPDANLRLRPLLLERLQPGARVVSNAFGMREWEPDEYVSGRGSGVYLWVVPAQVAGEWGFVLEDQRWELELAQQFQAITPKLQRDGNLQTVSRSVLRGCNLQLIVTIDDVRYAFHGEARGDLIEGFVQISDGNDERVERWSARRSAAR